jgi:hypothetical protein
VCMQLGESTGYGAGVISFPPSLCRVSELAMCVFVCGSWGRDSSPPCVSCKPFERRRDSGGSNFFIIGPLTSNESGVGNGDIGHAAYRVRLAVTWLELRWPPKLGSITNAK